MDMAGSDLYCGVASAFAISAPAQVIFAETITSVAIQIVFLLPGTSSQVWASILACLWDCAT